jgi:hypothetical protein
MVEFATEEELKLLRQFEAADPKQEDPMVFVGGFDPLSIDGARQTVCGGCGRAIWLSPSTQETIRERGDRPTEFMCVLCLAKLVEEEGQP